MGKIDGKNRWEKSEITSIKPIKIKMKNKNETPVDAFMATIKWEVVHDYFGEKGTGLGIFSQNGELLGSVEKLDPKKCNHQIIGNYLCLPYVNASYSDKYKGIGTALIQEAIRQSEKMGLGRQLKVEAYNYLKSEKGSPIPFYAKKGFIDPKNPHLSQEEIITKYANITDERSLIMFLLSSENKEKLINHRNKP